jgi:hypothetical protein
VGILVQSAPSTFARVHSRPWARNRFERFTNQASCFAGGH